MRRFMLGIGVAAPLAVGAAANADVTLFFGEPGFQWHATGVSPTPNHIWIMGDYWAQTFPGTGLASANEMTLRLHFDSNSLQSSLNMDVLLNDVTVGAFVINPGMQGLNIFNFSFASVAGDTFSVKMLATNTIPFGAGAVSMDAAGLSNVTLVPAPAAGSLLALGGLLAMRRRR